MPLQPSSEPGSADAAARGTAARNWVAALRALAQPADAAEHCDLCSLALPTRHPHLIDPRAQRLLCACAPCALLFSDHATSTYRRVPERMSVLALRVEATQWEALRIPINIVFFYRSSVRQRWIAGYPGPAGTTESQLDLRGWEEIVRANPELSDLEPDVEAVLINRLDGNSECFRAPIDRCYALVGLMRRNWRGIAGGNEAQRRLVQFLDALRAEADGGAVVPHA